MATTKTTHKKTAPKKVNNEPSLWEKAQKIKGGFFSREVILKCKNA